MHQLILNQISKTFKNQSAVFSNLSYTFYANQTYAIMAPSGEGKSTLLSIIAGIESVDNGSIMLNGNLLTDHTRHADISIIFQNPTLITELNVIQNVLLACISKNKFESIYTHRAHELLDLVGLSDKKESFIHQLSGGQQQRITIARALMIPPQFLLADEPTGNLDQTTAHSIMHIILNYCKNHHIGLIMSTHDKTIANMCDHVLTIKNKELSAL